MGMELGLGVTMRMGMEMLCFPNADTLVAQRSYPEHGLQSPKQGNFPKCRAISISPLLVVFLAKVEQ